MTIIEAKKIGSQQGLISVGIGISIAQLIMTWLISSDKGWIKAFFWIIETDYWMNILIGVGIMIASGHFYGQLAGILILVKKWNYKLTGLLSGMAVIWTTTFLAGWTGFFQEGIDNLSTNDNPFVDYIFKPMFWVSVFGFVPVMVVGIWFGNRINYKGKELKYL